MTYAVRIDSLLSPEIAACAAASRAMGDAVRRARNVIHVHPVAVFDRRGIAAVLAADADFDIRARGAAQLDAHLDHHADSLLVDGGEGVGSRTRFTAHSATLSSRQQSMANQYVLGDDFTAAVIAASARARKETLAAGVPVFYRDPLTGMDVM